MTSLEVLDIVIDVMNRLNLVPIIITVIIVIIGYAIIKKVLAKFRARGLISRGTEEAIKFGVLILSTFIVMSVCVSLWFQIYIASVVIVAVIIIIFGAGVYTIRAHLENSLSYMLFVSANIVKDGDVVKIDVGDKAYEGRITISEGGYAVVDGGDNKVYIPYNVLVKSVITKVTRNMARFKLRIEGQNLELDKVVHELKDTLTKEMKIINKENIKIRPLEVKDDEITLSISVEVLNPRNIEECYEVFTKLLSRKLSYRFSLEFI